MLDVGLALAQARSDLAAATRAEAAARERVRLLRSQLAALAASTQGVKLRGARGHRTGLQRELLAFLGAGGPAHMRELEARFAQYQREAVRQALMRLRRAGAVARGDRTSVVRLPGQA